MENKTYSELIKDARRKLDFAKKVRPQVALNAS